MSYILEALKRSEQERHQGELAHATIDTIMVPTKQVRHHWWPYLLIIVLVVNLIVYLYFKLADDAPQVESNQFVAPQEVSKSEVHVQKLLPVESTSLNDSFQSLNEKPLPAHLLQTPKLTKRYDVHDYSRQKKKAEHAPVKKRALNSDGLEVIRPKLGAKQISSEGLMTQQSRLDASSYKDMSRKEVKESESEQEFKPEPVLENFEDIEHLSDLETGFQKGIPNISFNSHIYSTNPADRRVMLNNLYLKERQGFSGMTIETIGEFYIVLTKGSQRFKLPVLRDWFTPE